MVQAFEASRHYTCLVAGTLADAYEREMEDKIPKYINAIDRASTQTLWPSLTHRSGLTEARINLN